MSGHGAPAPAALPDARGLRVAVIATRWHERITGALLESAVRTVTAAGAAEPTVVRVPGAFELPVVAAQLARDHDAVVCLAVIIRGGTPHFEYVSDAVTSGCTRVALDSGKAVGFGVLTCDNEAQAQDRSGLPGSREDKGAEAAAAALETAVLLAGLRAGATG
jgi:6,7-dimethyl-8-ribityllumazine synthase